MRVIKPNKLASTAQAVDKSKRGQSQAPKREVWDDFSANKKNPKKKEYEKGAGNRMFPASAPKNDKREKLSFSPEEEAGEQYQPLVSYKELEENLGYTFKDHELLSRALTHRSALGIKERADYERLEFLGDAVFDLSVAHLLSDLHPEATEGELSKMRAALVNTQALAEVAKRLSLGPYIRLGRGEHSSGGAERPSILADVLEAVLGAVYRDSSYDKAMVLVEQIFGDSLHKVTPFDPKTELQEVLHVAGSEPPSYLLELVEGPEHAPTFVNVVVVDGEIVGRGRGPTKKAAQQSAAAEALYKLGLDAPTIELAEDQKFFIPAALLSTNTDAAEDEDASADDEATEDSGAAAVEESQGTA